MNILIIGSGGREHALAWKIAQSPMTNNLYVSPGNAGTSSCALNIIMDVNDFSQVKAFCLEHHIDMIVVGPEAPLVQGFSDSICGDPSTSHIVVIGPKAYGAKLEGSKAFAKKFMERHHIPTAAYTEITTENIDEGYRFLERQKPPFVLKADGLAAGKGVLIIDDIVEAKKELTQMISGKFGKASSTVVVEEFLAGREFSVFAITNGKSYVLLPEAKDYKRVGEGDTGLNTGGMGAISPVSFVDSELWGKVIERIVKPTISGLHKENIDYLGFVFFGLISVDGDPFVIEYNCRMGDPETEVVIPRVESDLVDVLVKVASGEFENIDLKVMSQTAATIMLVSGGYPGEYKNGFNISLPKESDSMLFHAGTKLVDLEVVTSGGRVIAVTSMADNFKDAVAKSLQNAHKIHFDGMYYRKDIGFDL
jgi:phosphoribosylamine--glycine ligase